MGVGNSTVCCLAMTDGVLVGKVALVTGAGSTIGLGRAMSLALARAGARVAMCDVDSASLEQSVAEVRRQGGEAISVICDVGKPEDAEKAVSQAIRQFGGLHILINNAGIQPRFGQFWNLPPAEWSRTVATNMTGPFLMAHAAVPHLRAQGWGRIIGVTTSFDTMLRVAPYGPAKAGHEALVAVMARELAGSGVTANVLTPGRSVQTNMVPPGPDPRFERLQPEVMQGPAVWLASAESDGFNGRRIVAQEWDESLPIDERLAKASAPVGWPMLGRPGLD